MASIQRSLFLHTDLSVGLQVFNYAFVIKQGQKHQFRVIEQGKELSFLVTKHG
jgi:hypothetical protein